MILLVIKTREQHITTHRNYLTGKEIAAKYHMAYSSAMRWIKCMDKIYSGPAVARISNSITGKGYYGAQRNMVELYAATHTHRGNPHFSESDYQRRNAEYRVSALARRRAQAAEWEAEAEDSPLDPGKIA